METSKKVSIILTPEDLTAENIQTTVKTMEHHSNKFYLLKADWNTDLCYVIEDLSKESDDATLLTKTRMAYDLNFDLKTTLKIGDSDSDTELKTFADLLELMDFNENLILNRSDYHVIIDDSDSKSSDGENAADRAVAKLFQQIIFLNLNLDIQKKSEISKSLIKNIVFIPKAINRILIIGSEKVSRSNLKNESCFFFAGQGGSIRTRICFVCSLF